MRLPSRESAGWARRRRRPLLVPRTQSTSSRGWDIGAGSFVVNQVAPTTYLPENEPLLGVRPQPLPLAGYTLAIVAGALSAMQYGIVTVGKKEVPLQVGGSAALAYKEALDPLGSWTLTFGATACVVNACWLAGLSAHATATAAPLPALKLREVWAPASLAGVCYALSVIVTTLAVEKGGNALVPAQRNAVSLITSGAWGLVYYREVAGKAAVAWVGAAALTMASVVLLGLEKG